MAYCRYSLTVKCELLMKVATNCTIINKEETFCTMRDSKPILVFPLSFFSIILPLPTIYSAPLMMSLCEASTENLQFGPCPNVEKRLLFHNHGQLKQLFLCSHEFFFCFSHILISRFVAIILCP